MNAYRFNSMAQYYLKKAISEQLNINISDIYKIVKNIEGNIVETKDDKKYKITLTEIKDEKNR